MWQRSALSLLVTPLLVAACGHAQPSVAVAPTGAHVGVDADAPGAANSGIPTDAIRRSTIRATLAAGPGVFLQKIRLEDHPVFAAGRFLGYRIKALQSDTFAGVDLRPGDVVTSVNGMPIERPEEAVLPFFALATASELRVDYERDGVPRTLRYRIIDDEAPSPLPTTQKQTK